MLLYKIHVYIRTELLVPAQRPGDDRPPSQPQHFAQQVQNVPENQPSRHTGFVNNK